MIPPFPETSSALPSLLVGRESEAADVRQLRETYAVRLWVLATTGGVGTAHLAMAVAAP